MQNPAVLFERFAAVPVLGKRIFSKAIALTAPYFNTIDPVFSVVEPGRVEVTMKKRWSVQNHIGTIHAIALCNLCEAAAGVIIESTLQKELRWIPKGMTVRYLKKADTDATARARLAPIPDGFKGDVIVHVDVFSTRGDIVMDADINMYVSPRK